MAAGPVETGVLSGGVAFLRTGQGPPLVVLSPFSAAGDDAAGRRELKYLEPLAVGRTLWVLGRTPDRGRGEDYEGLARRYAEALAAGAAGAVDVVGVSSGGTLALHVALVAPERVRRLGVVAAGPRLSAAGRDASRRCAELIAAGRPRAGLYALAGALAEGPARMLLGAAMAAAGAGDRSTACNMAHVIAAECSFDGRERLARSDLDVLFVSGARDACYDIADARALAAAVPGIELLELGCGHIGAVSHRQAWPAVRRFLERP
jgi:pimeloyl-ACP methyl ester carboxylesterase